MITARPLCAAVLAAVVLSGCSTGVDRETVTAGASVAPTPGSSSAPSAAVPSPARSSRVIELAYSSGVVSGDTGRQEVSTGDDVVIRVTSDVAEQVHVHGYDLAEDIPAGGTAEIRLTASMPGGFEVELEESHKALFQLRVS